MNKNRHIVVSVVAALVAAFAGADAVAGSPEKELSNPKPGSLEVTGKWLRWNAPDAEKQWEEIIQNGRLLQVKLRMENAGDTQAEGQLEAFGTRYMPNAYAKYQEVRAKEIELTQLMRETFPEGEASDPTGGAMFQKAVNKCAVAIGQMFRRRDELCFFLLFHQAGIFTDAELAEYDSRPISVRLEGESADWSDDTPKADTALSAEDATFAGKYLPETLAGYQRLCNLFDEGGKQYGELRHTALALAAFRARGELGMLKSRLEEIQKTLQNYKKAISAQRLAHAFEDTTAEALAALDQANAVKIQQFEGKMGVKRYAEQVAERMAGKITLPGRATMEMVWCPPGTFTMGSDDGNRNERPAHQVTLTKGFWMAKTEVTQAQWKSVMGNNPSDHKGDNLPVENVSWDDCQKFCKKTGLQLPTEAQWEYACRAGSTGKYAGTGNLDDMGWYDDNSGGQTHPVGTKQPNAWGLYDMHGNVWEWCADWHGTYPSGAVTDPKGASSGSLRVMRGGCWSYGAAGCRSAYRLGSNPSGTGNYLGFRPVRTLSESQQTPRLRGGR